MFALLLSGTGCAAPPGADANADPATAAADRHTDRVAGRGSATRAPRPTEAGPSFDVTAKPGGAAGSQQHAARPTQVQLTSGRTVPVRVASTGARGLLQVPRDIRAAGWWDGGARLADAYGAVVIAGHVDSTTQGVGPFAELLSATPGDRIRVSGQSTTQRFVVDGVDLVPKVTLNTREEIFAASGPLRLVLITCAGPFLPDRGGYQDLAVVTARPAGVATRRSP